MDVKRWSRGQKTHLAHMAACLIPTCWESKVLWICYFPHMACRHVYYEPGTGVNWAKCHMLMNFWLTTFLISLHKEVGRWSVHGSTAPKPLSSCMPSITDHLPADWFRQLIALQANAKIICLWVVCVCVCKSALSHCQSLHDTMSKQRHMGRTNVIIEHMMNGKRWRLPDDLSRSSTKDYSCINLECLENFHVLQTAQRWLMKYHLFMQTAQKHVPSHAWDYKCPDQPHASTIHWPHVPSKVKHMNILVFKQRWGYFSS